MTKQQEEDIKSTIDKLKSYGIKCETFWATEDKRGNVWIAPTSITDRLGFINSNNFVPTDRAGERILNLYATN